MPQVDCGRLGEEAPLHLHGHLAGEKELATSEERRIDPLANRQAAEDSNARENKVEPGALLAALHDEVHDMPAGQHDEGGDDGSHGGQPGHGEEVAPRGAERQAQGAGDVGPEGAVLPRCALLSCTHPGDATGAAREELTNYEGARPSGSRGGEAARARRLEVSYRRGVDGLAPLRIAVDVLLATQH